MPLPSGERRAQLSAPGPGQVSNKTVDLLLCSLLCSLQPSLRPAQARSAHHDSGDPRRAALIAHTLSAPPAAL